MTDKDFEIETHMENFFKTYDLSIIPKILDNLKSRKLYHIGDILCEQLLELFPFSVAIMLEKARFNVNLNRHEHAFDLYIKILQNIMSEKDSSIIIEEKNKCVEKINSKYIFYNHNIIDSIMKRKEKQHKLVTFSITTCKRLDLFIKTMNSFINCCEDLDKIDRWILVDDNSSEEDREKMKSLYPFFEFHFKTLEDKGHVKSINMIYDIVNTPFLFHMEDDWVFFEKRNYISNCLEVLTQHPNISQCLLNKNYSELAKDNIKGGLYNTTRSGLRFYLHEYTHNEETKNKFIKKYGECSSCCYWPHFSLRPSLLKVNNIKTVGRFNEEAGHFEMEFAKRYFNNKFISCFLEGTYCEHIGKLTKENNSKVPNAYKLNNESQFSQTKTITEQNDRDIEEVINSNEEKKLATQIQLINLNSRSDRLKNMMEKLKVYRDKISHIERLPAVEGNLLETEDNFSLFRIFENNDYRMRAGIVGAALSHLKLWTNLIKNKDKLDCYIVLEDDVNLEENFYNKLKTITSQLKTIDWDFVYLGESLRKQYITDDIYSNKMPILKRTNTEENLRKSFGGAFAYIISQNGAEKMLEYINQTGMTNAIDTMIQKNLDNLNAYYSEPYIVKADCYDYNPHVDTDIQTNFNYLEISLDDKLNMEKNFFINNFLMIIQIESVLDLDNLNSNQDTMVYSLKDTRENIKTAINICKNKDLYHYTIDDVVLFVITSPTDKIKQQRSQDRLKKNGVWDISDSIKYIF